MDFNKAFETKSIQLEPRLQEYLNAKRFNKENSIDPGIPEEQEFNITAQDIKLIKKFKKGDGNLYSRKNVNNNLDNESYFVQSSGGNFDEPLNDFKNDPRYKRLQKKMESHKQAKEQIKQYHHMDEEYTMFHQPNPYNETVNAPNSIEKPYFDPNHNYKQSSTATKASKQLMMDSRDLAIGPSRLPPNKRKNAGTDRNEYVNPLMHSHNQPKRSMVYNNPPKISYNNYLSPMKVNGGLPHQHSTTDIIGRVNNYNKHLDKTYEYTDDFADLDAKMFHSAVKTCTQRENSNNYNNVPFMYGNGMMNIDVENSMRGGYRDSSKKSSGFKSSFENNFQYISPDIQNVNHVVNDRPLNTRGANKESARYSDRRN